MPGISSRLWQVLQRPGVRRFGFETLEPRHLLSAANLQITEFMATNTSTLLSGDLNYDDWIEIYNADSISVDLGDYYLTDSLDDLTKWAMPAITLTPGEYLVIFASGPVDIDGNPIQNKVDSALSYHASFKLNSQGEELALTYSDPASQAVSIVQQYAPEFPEQFPDVSYGVASDLQLRYFDTPTPGAANGAGLVGVVEDTQFSIDRGFYDAPFDVEITTQTPDAAVYYTTDGSAPTPGAGTLYTGPITIDHSTVLRAMAAKSGYLPTNVDTQTYLFLNDVINQSDQTAIAAGYPSIWEAENGVYTADYGFDPDVVGAFDADGNPLGGDDYGGVYASRLKDDLLAIPTISIVLDPEDMFANGPRSDRGIYIDPRKGRNLVPERATSVEWITPDGAAVMQVDAGIQIQGGAFRSHFLTRKHSFRLVFKDEYGPSELNFPLFGPSAVDQFNTVVLKATANDGYSWRAAQPSAGPSTLQYTRDQFGHSLQREMGHASPNDAYAHLYINGLYWGVYYAQERPDAEFAESYLGVNPDTWDGLNSPDDDDDPPEADSGNLDAWYAMLEKTHQAGSSLQDYMELQGLNLDGSLDPSTAPLLDVVNYIDYMIVNVWGGNDDWPHHNWWAGRDRNSETTKGFQFFLWDYDGVMGNSRGWSPLDTQTFDQGFTSPVGNNVGEPHFNLQGNPEYQLAFADRVHKWFFNDGLLTAESLIARYQALADRVEQVMVAESARWGDMNSPTPTPLVLTDWESERDYLLSTYLPQRSGIVLQEMRDYGFYPDVDAPTFSRHGGLVASGFELEMQSVQGTVYYTLDGSDPRLVGGGVGGSAVAYGVQPVEITANLTVKARTYHAGEWSALNEAEFSLIQPGDVAELRITELQYHPADFAGIIDDEDLEFLEILNTDTATVSLDGVQIGGFASEPYTFADGLTLSPGERIVVARNVAAFQSIYGTEVNLAPAGYSDRNLSNGGEEISLLGPEGQVLQSFTYSDDPPWPTMPDGGGPSLEIIDPLGDPNDPVNWRASLYHYGSPGVEGLPITGDYDLSGVVDQADYLQWWSGYGAAVSAPGGGADGNFDGVIDSADYTIWRDHYGDSTTLYGGQVSVLLASLSSGPGARLAADSAVDVLKATHQRRNVSEPSREAAFALLGDFSPNLVQRATAFAEDAPDAPSRLLDRLLLLLDLTPAELQVGDQTWSNPDSGTVDKSSVDDGDRERMDITASLDLPTGFDQP